MGVCLLKTRNSPFAVEPLRASWTGCRGTEISEARLVTGVPVWFDHQYSKHPNEGWQAHCHDKEQPQATEEKWCTRRTDRR